MLSRREQKFLHEIEARLCTESPELESMFAQMGKAKPRWQRRKLRIVSLLVFTAFFGVVTVACLLSGLLVGAVASMLTALLGTVLLAVHRRPKPRDGP